MEPSQSDPAVAVALKAVSKTYGATRALIDVDVEIHEGTVHALIGENGAGKSTALGAIAGRVDFDGGVVEVFGEPLEPGNLRAARRSGVSAIYQELTIIPHLDAAANVFLGSVLSRLGVLSSREMRRRYVQLCTELDVRVIPAGVPVGTLSVAEQQLLEIMRSLVIDPRVILFDEPSASLAVEEREALYKAIEGLRKRGVTIVIVSHNFDEIERLADWITVFRNGRAITTSRSGEKTRAELVRAMLGDQRGDQTLSRVLLDKPVEIHSRPVEPAVAPILEVVGLTVPGAIENIDLEVKPGEILGIAGLVGSGRSTLLRAIAGAEPTARGTIRLAGAGSAWPRTVRAARKLGIGLIPEDRKGEGLVLLRSAADNIALSNLGSASTGGVIGRRKLRAMVADAASRLNFPVARLGERSDRFSGGNQQKLLMARWLYDRPRVLLADEPTRGIDVGAKGELLETLRLMAAEGVAVIMVSSELEEVLAVSDRVLVIAKGHSMGLLERTGDQQIAMEDVLQAAFGLKEHA
ncbi:sugar ABC transporter ATP-binding protein [Pseudarthrobacter sp. BRE9]|uniref:sugar ABC transporter ATP-binding protein n=1 Tax=Pseudarthrobacter sp. BRE9 TaxID=2962582 RepID=UPI002881C205|nr:sugar ABC transporter ATP-binding protein [Pseudarthrobacter sp. BRE9]MDT0168390.1 sugar ABC transporter ATP-binding protein [Pseudarthrobacter sp. BRE9]